MTTKADDLIDEIYQELEDMMDPEYTRVQLVRKIKMMLNLMDEYIDNLDESGETGDDTGPEETTQAQLSEFSEPKDPRG